ncbi:MAG: PAS domain S-box protein [Gemmatimonadaceae bacterium]
MRLRGGSHRSGPTLEESFAFFFEHSDQAYYVFDPESLEFLAVNEAAVRRYGYTREEFRRMTLRDIRPPEDMAAFTSANMPLGRGVKHVGRFRHRARDGRIIPVEIATYDIHVRGRYLRLVEAIDLSDTVRSGEELRQWEERFRPVAESLSEGLMLMDLTGTIQYANPVMKHFLGLRREDVIGRNVREFMRPERRAMAETNLQERVKGHSAIIEDAILRADGSHLWAEIHAAPFVGPDGSIIGALNTFIDISQRRKAQEELEHSLSLLKATLESTADGILVVDRNGIITSWNESFRVMWRIPPGMVEGGSDIALMPHFLSQLKDPGHFVEKIRRLYTESPSEESFDVIEFTDGRVFERYSLPQRIGDQIVGRVWSFRDVTERRRSEAQLLQSQKVEAIGLLAGGVAHDFNNVLTAILGSAELALLETSGNERATLELEEIRRTAMNASALTRQLLLFSRKRERKVERLSLNSAVRSAERLLRRLIPEDLALSFKYEDSLGDVVVDPGELEQVMMNLAVNARDATERGGSIVVSTARRHNDSRTSEDEPATFAVLRVADTGAGMTPEVRERIFEPFFTTKPAGKGTGLGMPAVQAIVERSGARIDVTSAPGAGTTVEIQFPELYRATPSPTTPQELPMVRTAGERILIVEDAPALRRSTRRMLEQHGYQVRDATNGAEALELLTAEGADDFTMVLTDVVMPRMGGRELAGHIIRRWPSLKVMLMTGYDDGGVADDVTRKLPLLEKPFSMKDLLHAVRRTIDTPAPRTR